MEYVVFKKDTYEQKHFSDVVKVTETPLYFTFKFYRGRQKKFSKLKYEICRLEVEELNKEKKKTEQFVTKNRLNVTLPVMPSKEKLAEILNRFFNIEDTYTYWLTRVESAFNAGTVTIDDFEEFTDETINELADFIINEIMK